MLHILNPGLQSTLQGAPRIGTRHLGLPYAGPADPLSMKLANHLVANPQNTTCLEITYGGFEAVIEQACSVAITGALSDIHITGNPAPAHKTLQLKAGDTLTIAPPLHGARSYLAVHTGFQATLHFGSTSTYLPAELGGHNGRALIASDILRPNKTHLFQQIRQTPDAVRPVFTNAFALRTCTSAETLVLSAEARETLFNANFIAGRQATRMGVSLTGHTLDLNSDGMMQSAAVFPGTIQCPPSGEPVLLLCDAQTTGGYPRIASIARCDRHLLGQIRPGASVQLLERSPQAAIAEFTAKEQLLQNWLQTN